MDFGDDLDPRLIKERAALHEEHRHRTIATILADLHLMAASGFFPSHCLISAEHADWRDFQASERRGTEAAHCVPCQIRINSERPDQHMRKYSPDRAEKIKAYFIKTDRFLPSIFNKCDSQAERFGLVSAFCDACIEALNSGLNSQSIRQATVTMHVKNAFSLYEGRAQGAYGFTLKHYEQTRNYYAKFDPDRLQEIEMQMKIIQHYNTELTNSSAIEDITRLGEMKELVEIYRGLDLK